MATKKELIEKAYADLNKAYADWVKTTADLDRATADLNKAYAKPDDESIATPRQRRRRQPSSTG